MNKSLLVFMTCVFIVNTKILSYEIKTIPVGETFSIELKSNITTGCKWRCICVPDDCVAITNKYTPDAAALAARLIGSGGTETFAITAKKPCTIECTFEYGQFFGASSKVYGEPKKYRITFVQD